ncbi:hypothetical protein B0H14DRAFT_2500435 [Mycena olivaceomarginata]|nr:hypothetical protein B0H14DRAFT_2500435 [Mycena olivaceomarginata]
MDKRFGAEGKLGIAGGGLVSEESQQKCAHDLSSQIAEDLYRKGKHTDAFPHLQIALKDRNNFDADIQLAYLTSDPSLSVQLLECAEKRARALLISRLGADCFDDNGPCVGKYGDSGLLLTRPYMRVLQGLVRMCFDAKQYEKAARTIIETLRLGPSEALDQRWWLAPLLIRTGRFADALFFCQLWIHLDVEDSVGRPIRGGTVFRAPSDKLLPPEMEEEYAQRAPTGMMHSAALAAFRLWGRSPQTAQLLRIAARTNPDILARIMARRARPSSSHPLCKHHSSMNGPDEAYEYLWTAQDLWMAPDVWNWVNEDSAVRALILKSCGRPECAAQETEATQFKRCSGCQLIVYCGASCQKTDWKSHKADCNQRVEMKKILKNIWKNKTMDSKVCVLQGGLDEWPTVL